MDAPLVELPDFHLRPLRDEDAPALVALFARAYRREMDEATWRWKVRAHDVPFDNGFVALDGARPIGQYAALPLRARIGGAARYVTVGVDAMVDPDYRRRGVWSALVRHAHQTWARAGVAMAIGLPNERWGSRVDALGWRPLFPLRWRLRPLRPGRWLARRSPLPGGTLDRLFDKITPSRDPPPTGIEITPLDHAGDALDALWREIGTRYPNGLTRDAARVTWRYLAAPEPRYRVLVARRAGRTLGYAALRVRYDPERALGFLAELVGHPDEAGVAEALLDAALDEFRVAGCELAATLTTPGSALERYARRAGFWLSWGAFTVRAVPLDPALEIARLRDPASWLMFGGDFDAI